MLCSCESHLMPCVSRSDAFPLSNVKPQVSPGLKSFRRKPLPSVIQNGWTYFWMRSSISCLAMAQRPLFGGRSLILPLLRLPALSGLLEQPAQFWRGALQIAKLRSVLSERRHVLLNVRYWHFSDILPAPTSVRYGGKRT